MSKSKSKHVFTSLRLSTWSLSPPTDSKVTPMSISMGWISAMLEPAFCRSLNFA